MIQWKKTDFVICKQELPNNPQQFYSYKKEIEKGNIEAIEIFYKKIKLNRTPLIESSPNTKEFKLVTFLRIESLAKKDTRIIYSFSINDPLLTKREAY